MKVFTSKHHRRLVLGTIVFISLTMNSTTSLAQNSSTKPDSVTLSAKGRMKGASVIGNGVRLFPGKSDVIHGWAIGWGMSLDEALEHKRQSLSLPKRIHGMHTNLSPLPAVLVVYASPFALFGGLQALFEGNVSLLKTQNERDSAAMIASEPDGERSLTTKDVRVQIDGVSLATFEIGEYTALKGMQVSAVFNSMNRVDGFTIALVVNYLERQEGLMISTCNVISVKGKGVQIGLVNIAESYRGVQLGLWNRNGKRSFPLINFNLRRSKADG